MCGNKKLGDKEGETGTFTRKCGHKFHKNCIDFYINKYGAFACWTCRDNKDNL